MWIAAFMTKNGPGATGAYFVVFFASAMFNVVFWPLACYQYAKGGISKETIRYTKSRKHYKVRHNRLDRSERARAEVPLHRLGVYQLKPRWSSASLCWVCVPCLLGSSCS